MIFLYLLEISVNSKGNMFKYFGAMSTAGKVSDVAIFTNGASKDRSKKGPWRVPSTHNIARKCSSAPELLSVLVDF